MFQQMYEEMLERVKEQLEMTKGILDDFVKLSMKAKDKTDQTEIDRCQRNIDYEQGYKAGVQSCLNILESYYDRIS